MLSDDPLWYKDAIIYELHVRAFCDSVGDGYGDFGGLTRKLDYLEDLGVTAIWLLPFYPSPLKDDGYDIADYTSVHPQYGNLRDFKTFLDEAHRRGLRVITELVINHTSDKHPWFQRARHASPGSRERDFYVWSDTPEKYTDARIIFKDFEPSNWTWDPVAKAYYWHRFYSHQPDLNYDNPAVWEAIFPVLDFWMNLGVDGMRLDAVPYLYEREGTNCENLPETHAFLKALRKHVDEKFPNRMLLAEANQWPEDAVAYFGDGDECHMCFHFPVMPRLFMALHQEDRFPILDILAQTPTIPDNAQWCMFLRNHDELTLEMVTDEERDYMYRAYAGDPQARINLGIRRRLAPLLRNDRRRIELMNGLLFALPGTPVVYYGDEIGMGDNIYLGDRNGVRTPMQWSSDRNAGFSRANPQKLYLPVIIDPEYHYEALNVEAQQNSPSSLLWWMKRLIALRKHFKAFGRGSLDFLRPENPKILAFIRRFEDEKILVVANLSRFVQYAELDLKEFEGLVPEEMFGRTAFPPIGELPYLVTLAPYAFYWFALVAPKPGQRGDPGPATAADVPVLTHVGKLEDLFREPDKDRLEDLLPDFLRRRWPAGAGVVRNARIIDARPVRHVGAPGMLVMVQVESEDGIAESALLALTVVSEEETSHLLEPVGACGLVWLRGECKGLLCDALAHPLLTRALPATIAANRTARLGDGELAATCFVDPSALASAAEVAPGLRRGQRNNLTVTYADQMVLKVFRRLDEGINPDLEVGRFLDRQGFNGMAPVLGAIEFRRHGRESATVGVLHKYVPHQSDAWRLTLDQLSQFFERVLSLPRDTPPPGWIPLLNGPPHAGPDLLDEMIGSYRNTAIQLAVRTAELHSALARDTEDTRFAPEPFGRLYQRSVYQSMRNLTGHILRRLGQGVEGLDEPTRGLIARLLDRHGEILKRFRGILDLPPSGRRIRVHGDFHLGHLLYTGNDFVVIDFEGDSLKPIGERRIKRSPLRDVASMVRSFHYAAMGTLLGLTHHRGSSPGMIREEDRAILEPWVNRWYERVAATYIAAYLEHAAGDGLLPTNSEERRHLFEAVLLEKALHEVDHELDTRPEWVMCPLIGALRVLDGTA